MSDGPVLVVGAGPTGLVLAIELARRGVPFHLIDRHPQPLAWDRAMVVKSRSLEILAAMGLADGLVRCGRIIRGVNLFVGETKAASVRFGALDSPYPFMLGIPENETERLLTERLEQLGGRVERGVEFVGLEQGECGVQVRLRALDHAERTLEASWVFGADGVHSGVREAIGDQFDGHDNPTRWGVVDGHLAGWDHPRDCAAVQLEPPSVNPIPLADGRWRIYFRPDPGEADPLNTVGARLATMSPGVALQDPDQPQLFHTHSRVARRYRIGRVLVGGDAAHACSPIQGHGMNTGMQDAFNLGWKLALVAIGASPQTLLDSYEAERRPIAQAIALSGDEAEGRVLQPDPAPRQDLVAFLASAEGRAAAAMAESELDFGYAQSPIIASGARAAGTRPGFRVGDAGPLEGQGESRRLHALLAAPASTLLLLLGEADQAALADGLALANAAAQRYRPHLQAYVVTRNSLDGPDTLLCDPTGTLHARLGADLPCLCLIRPDGHLGLHAVPPSLEALQAHLGGIFG